MQDDSIANERTIECSNQRFHSFLDSFAIVDKSHLLDNNCSNGLVPTPDRTTGIADRFYFALQRHTSHSNLWSMQ